ncbi:hypothetical protein SKAU_G00065610 [Synaphobranchus kaupii]|uniref:Uncharacterized protein n=1 Tax=Synaphobranchus kaupii TaxID=118154 RepID=A0A9Q1G6N6_SYNKA|nr:hypothetical protein SKAU_G00065610 [Synaphobranchus kaupii]
MNQSALKGQIQNETRPQCQTKSLQFRSIAPKAPPAVSAPPAVLSCQPPSTLPEASAAVSPKSIIVPAQNYALMQVAGQEGTFSLVALPPSLSPQSPQPIQKGLPHPQKLEAAHPQCGPSPSECPESGSAVEPPEQVIVIDPGSSEMAVTTLLADNTALRSGSQVEKSIVPDKVEGEQPTSGLLQNLHCPSNAGSSETLIPQLIAGCRRLPYQAPGGWEEVQAMPLKTCQPATQQHHRTLSGCLQQGGPNHPLTTQGKLPILPYSKMKSTLIPVAKSSQNGPISPQGPWGLPKWSIKSSH